MGLALHPLGKVNSGQLHRDSSRFALFSSSTNAFVGWTWWAVSDTSTEPSYSGVVHRERGCRVGRVAITKTKAATNTSSSSLDLQNVSQASTQTPPTPTPSPRSIAYHKIPQCQQDILPSDPMSSELFSSCPKYWRGRERHTLDHLAS